MGTIVTTPWCPRFASFPVLRFLLGLLVAVALGGCAQSFRPPGRAVPGPAGAFAAAPLSGGRIAVLAGDDRTKAVFIIDQRTGVVLGSYGVTKEATGIAAQSDDGPLLLSVGAKRDGKVVGAVEQWSLDGIKERIVPMPTEALGITPVERGVAYVLLAADGGVRAAVPIDAPSLRVGSAIPLGADASSLQHCWSDDGDYLLYSEGDRQRLTIRHIGSNGEAQSEVVADGEACSRDGSYAYAIAGDALGRNVLVMSLPQLGALRSIPASRDAIALYETDDHHLVALNSTRRVATIETFRGDAFDQRTAANQFTASIAR